MTITTEQAEQHFETHADGVADILRWLGGRWGGKQQIDHDDQEDTLRKRYCLGYSYPTEDQRGEVFALFWHGVTGAVIESDDGKQVSIELLPGAYPCARIAIEFVADHLSDEFAVDGKHRVYSTGELKDRMNVMWNSDEWGLNSEFLEENAELHRQFVVTESFYNANMKPIAATLKKLGEAWGGEQQTDNTPDTDDSKGGLGNLFGGGSAPKRFFVGFILPQFKVNPKGQAAINQPAVWLDLWQGKKGVIKKAAEGRMVTTEDKLTKRIVVKFSLGQPSMFVEGVDGAMASSAQEMRATLTQLWKQDAFKLR